MANRDKFIGQKYNYWTIIDYSNDNKKMKCQCNCGTIKDINFYNLTHNKSQSCGCKPKNRIYTSLDFEIGSKINEFTILEKTNKKSSSGEYLWKCQCSCGNIVLERSSTLKLGKIQHCQNHIEDYTNKKFGRLTVIENTGKRYQNRIIWKCLCECGNYVEVPAGRLQSGNTQSCGCLAKEKASQICKNNILNDLQGKKFGKLTALEIQIENFPGKQVGKTYWKCKCECGRECNVIRNNLLNGNTQSCGHHNISKGENYIKDLLIKNNIPFIHHYKNLSWRYPNSNYIIEFDFYVNNKYIIEYDGLQHSQPIEYYGGEKELKKIQEKDKYRNQLCKNNNIPIIRIPYNYDLSKITIDDLRLETTKYLVE